MTGFEWKRRDITSRSSSITSFFQPVLSVTWLSNASINSILSINPYYCCNKKAWKHYFFDQLRKEERRSKRTPIHLPNILFLFLIAFRKFAFRVFDQSLSVIILLWQRVRPNTFLTFLFPFNLRSALHLQSFLHLSFGLTLSVVLSLFMQVTSRGCSRAYIVCVLWRAWEYVRLLKSNDSSIAFPFADSVVVAWLTAARSDCTQATEEFLLMFGGTEFTDDDPTSYWTISSHFFTW